MPPVILHHRSLIVSEEAAWLYVSGRSLLFPVAVLKLPLLRLMLFHKLALNMERREACWSMLCWPWGIRITEQLYLGLQASHMHSIIPFWTTWPFVSHLPLAPTLVLPRGSLAVIAKPRKTREVLLVGKVQIYTSSPLWNNPLFSQQNATALCILCFNWVCSQKMVAKFIYTRVHGLIKFCGKNTGFKVREI